MSRKNRGWPSAERNSIIWNYYFYRLYNMAISEFEWVDLPETIDERFLENVLFYKGFALFFKDPVVGYLSLNTTIGAPLNVYNLPTEFTAYASNGYNVRLNASEAVLIWNNYAHTPDVQNIYHFCDELWEIEQTARINLKGQKTPILIAGSESQQLTLKNLMMKVDGGEPFIFGDKSMDISGIKVFQTGAPFLLKDLYEYKQMLWNEALTYLGINNTPQEKRERLLSDEVNANVEEIKASRFSRLNARRQAADQINRMFGLNISVKFREEIDTIVDYKTGVKQVGAVYNANTQLA